MNIQKAIGAIEVSKTYSPDAIELMKGLHWDGAKQCDEVVGGYGCTRKADHTNAHIAHDSAGDVVAVWPAHKLSRFLVTVTVTFQGAEAAPGFQQVQLTRGMTDLSLLLESGGYDEVDRMVDPVYIRSVVLGAARNFAEANGLDVHDF